MKNETAETGYNSERFGLAAFVVQIKDIWKYQGDMCLANLDRVSLDPVQ